MYYIGVDIGTTSTKIVLFNGEMKILDMESSGYETAHREPYFSEQDPDEVYTVFLDGLKMLLKRNKELLPEIAYVAFSSAMHSLILLDEQGKPLTPNVLWSDNRAQEIVRTVKNQGGSAYYYEKTGVPLHAMSPFFKLQWFREHSDLLNRARKIVGIKEYLLFKIVEDYVTDYSVATATGLFNIHKMCYDEELLSELNLTEDQLPKAEDVRTLLDIKSVHFLRETGLSPFTKVLLGASDGCLANLGADAVLPSEAAVTLGTSGAIRTISDRIHLHPEGKTFCYYLDQGKYVIGGAVNNGGNVMTYLSGLLQESVGTVYESLPEILQATEPGAEGLVFVPYVFGERAPHYDGHLTGGFYGITPLHERKHFVRAVVEGILFNLKEVLEALEELNGEISVLKVSGAVFENGVISGLAASVINRKIIRQESFTASAAGAVLLGRETGFQNRKPAGEVFLPAAEVERYEVLYRRYRKVSYAFVELKNSLETQDTP